MEQMKNCIWLFPVIFIFHDMEEIIGIRVWYEKNKKMLDRNYPRVSRRYVELSTEGFAAAVLEEFVLCIIICLMAFLTDFRYGFLLWLGTFIACTLHFVIHIGQALLLRQYIPALITSILLLPVSVWIIGICIKAIDYSVMEVLLSGIVGSVIVAGNLKLAQMFMKRFKKNG